jgi:D-methionine transport system substrate-binding protein
MSRFLIFFSLLFALAITSCNKHEHVLKIAATPVPHAELLTFIKPELEKEGIHLKIVEVDDYNLANRLLAEKQVDANFFQHLPFLEEQNHRFGYHLVPLVAVHIEPLGIYSEKVTSIQDVRERGIIAIPNDPTNEARALTLLQEVGLIKLKTQAPGHLTTIYDIEENPKQLKFQEVDAAFLPRSLADVDLAVIPANYALQAHLNPEKDALALEPSDSPYANIVAVREGDEHKEDLQKLKEALTSEKMRTHILEKYKGAIIPAF